LAKWTLQALTTQFVNEERAAQDGREPHHRARRQAHQLLSGQAIALAGLLLRLHDFNIVTSCTAPRLSTIGPGAVEYAIKALKLRPVFMTSSCVRSTGLRCSKHCRRRSRQKVRSPSVGRSHARSKKRQGAKHHPALPWKDLPKFIRELEALPRWAARTLRLLILNATRTNEVRFARPEEFDLDSRIWSIPGERTKSGRPPRVPLRDRAVELAREATKKVKCGYLFPGFRQGLPRLNMTMLTLLVRMERDEITVQGFRSTFRDWATECTHYPDSLAEEALAHTITSQTVAAYWRRDRLERRRQFMEDWSAYGAGQHPPAASVTSAALQPFAA
jgi:integrase